MAEDLKNKAFKLSKKAGLRSDAGCGSLEEPPHEPKKLMEMEKDIIETYFAYMDAVIEVKLFLAQFKGIYFDPSELKSTSKHQNPTMF